MDWKSVAATYGFLHFIHDVLGTEPDKAEKTARQVAATSQEDEIMFQAPVQREMTFYVKGEQWRKDRVNPDNPSSPYHKFIGNRHAIKRLGRADFKALGNYNHDASDTNFALLGPASTGKTYLAKLRAKVLELPFVEVHPRSIETPNDLLVDIGRTLKDTKRTVDGQEYDLRLIPKDEGYIVLPPCIVFIDEVHSLRNSIVQALLLATEPKGRVFETEKGWKVNCANVCWMIATTDRGKLFDAFDTRFNKIYLDPYSQEEQAEVVALNYPDLPKEACKLVAHYGGSILREVLMFGQDVLDEAHMNGGTWQDICAKVAEEHGIDEFGMTERRVAILKALAGGPVAKNRMPFHVNVKAEELERFIMPALLTPTPDRPACVGVTSKGYELTAHGKEELRKREIPQAA